jgi:hypothetical protein
VDEQAGERRFTSAKFKPADERQRSETGAGRIVSVRMRPLTLPERGGDTPTVSLTALLTDHGPEVERITITTLEDYTTEISPTASPGIRHSPARPSGPPSPAGSETAGRRRHHQHRPLRLSAPRRHSRHSRHPPRSARRLRETLARNRPTVRKTQQRPHERPSTRNTVVFLHST